MKEKVIETIKKFNMLKHGDSVVIGLSGGADSVSLAHILLGLKDEYSLELTAVHVNHNIRTTGALNDQRFVEDFCKKHSLPLKVFSIDVKKTAAENSLTLEEAGRQQRYLAFDNINADKTAVAHNLNDNAETMIMRLCRGTGIKGLAGILPVRGNIIRPLIMCSRNEIETYCRENGLDYCIDETNLETDYTRNKIRRLVLPLLEEINPNTVDILGKSARIFRQENAFLEKTARQAYENCRSGGGLSAEGLKQLDLPILYRVLRLACENSVGLKDIGLEHIELIRELLYRPSGKKIMLPKGLTVFREYDNIVFSTDNSDTDIILDYDSPVKINGREYIISRQKYATEKPIGIFCEKKGPEWHIRTRKSGDVFIRGDNKCMKLKKHLIDKKIPVSQRDTLLLLAEGKNIYYIEGMKNKFSAPNYFLYIREGEQ